MDNRLLDKWSDELERRRHDLIADMPVDAIYEAVALSTTPYPYGPREVREYGWPEGGTVQFVPALWCVRDATGRPTHHVQKPRAGSYVNTPVE